MSSCHLWFPPEEGHQLYLAMTSLQLCALIVQYPTLAGIRLAAAALTFVPNKVISIFFAIVFENEAVHLH